VLWLCDRTVTDEPQAARPVNQWLETSLTGPFLTTGPAPTPGHARNRYERYDAATAARTASIIERLGALEPVAGQSEYRVGCFFGEEVPCAFDYLSVNSASGARIQCASQRALATHDEQRRWLELA
jgi:hypothetical protein